MIACNQLLRTRATFSFDRATLGGFTKIWHATSVTCATLLSIWHADNTPMFSVHLHVLPHQILTAEVVRAYTCTMHKSAWQTKIYENANVLNKVNNYMQLNLLHINLSKSVYMHFRPNYNIQERLTCARIRQYDYENVVKITEYK